MGLNVLFFLTFAWTWHNSAGLLCSICQHTGLSMMPPNAPNTRFVFDSTVDDCLDEEIECGPNENFCLAVSAMVSGDRYWVQKGCVAAEADHEFVLDEETDSFANGSGCTKQHLEDTQIRNMPVDLEVITSLETTVCVCNMEDFCNRGSVSRMERAPGRNGGTGTRVLTFTNGALWIVAIALIVRRSLD